MPCTRRGGGPAPDRLDRRSVDSVHAWPHHIALSGFLSGSAGPCTCCPERFRSVTLAACLRLDSLQAFQLFPIQVLLQLLTRGVDAAHDRADRDVLRFSDLFVTQSQLGEQNEGRPDLGAEVVEGLVQRPAKILLMQASGRVIMAGRFGQIAAAIPDAEDGTPFTAASPIQGRVANDSQEPVPKPAATVKISQSQEGLDECFLNHVQGVLLVPQQPVGHPVGIFPVALKQFFACNSIPLPRASNQSLVRRLHAGGSVEHTITCAPRRRKSSVYSLFRSPRRAARCRRNSLLTTVHHRKRGIIARSRDHRSLAASPGAKALIAAATARALFPKII